LSPLQPALPTFRNWAEMVIKASKGIYL